MIRAFIYRHRQQISGLLNLGGSRLALTGLSFLSGILIARSLGPELLGIFALLTGAFAYMSIISEFGLRSAMTAEASRHGVTRSTLRAYLFLRISISTIVYLTTMAVTIIFFPVHAEPTAMVMFSLFFFALQVDWILLAEGKYGAAGWIPLTRWIAYLGLIATVIHFSELDLNLLASIFLISWIVTALSSWLAVKRKDFTQRKKTKEVPIGALKLLKAGSPILGATLVSQALQNADLLWIGKVFGAYDAGHYYLANSIITATLVFANAMGQMAIARYASFNEDPELIGSALRSDIRFMTLASITISIFLLLAAPELILIFFGEKFALAGSLIINFLPYLVLYHIWSLLFSVCIAIRMEKALLKSKLVTLAALIAFLAAATQTNTLTAFALGKGLILFPATILIYYSLERAVQKQILGAFMQAMTVAITVTILCIYRLNG